MRQRSCGGDSADTDKRHIKKGKGRRRSMNTVITKHGEFIKGQVKLCVPICEREIDGIGKACALLQEGIDAVEWRMDYFCGKSKADWLKALHLIRTLIKDRILLVTWRSQQEGGVQACTKEDYIKRNEWMITDGAVDLIDVELFRGEDVLTHLIHLAHDHDVRVVISNHDMQKTPSSEAMMIRMRAMTRMGGDLVKLAVMPETKNDVYRLLQLSSEYSAQSDSVPAITMAMGKLGFITRICGEMSGSVMSFASLNQASAPGQLPWDQLRALLRLFHEGYGKKNEK